MNFFFLGFIAIGLLTLGGCGSKSDCECEQLSIDYAYVSATHDFDYNNFDIGDYEDCFERYLEDERRGKKSGLNIGIWGTPNGWFNYLCEHSEHIDLNTTSSSEEDAVEETEEEMEVSDDNTEYSIIEDPDGYSNLREVPSGNVIRKVYVGEKFEIIGEVNNYKKVQFSDASTGYIHNSRVVNFNDKVCECLHSADEMIKKDLDKDFSTGSETGFSDNWKPSYTERLVEIFRYNQCPKGCDFLGDHDVIDFQSEIQRCSE
jgi:hypothetical protein